MDKDELIALGLSEEQADAVSVALEAQQMIPKARFDQVNEAKKSLELQVSDFSSQLKTLQESAKGNEDLQNEIKALQQAQLDAKNKYEQDLADNQLKSAIYLDLVKGGDIVDVDMFMTLIDKTQVTLDENGMVKDGLQQQKDAYKETKGYFFNVEKPQEKPSFSPVGVKPVKSNEEPGVDVSIGSQMAQKMNQTKTTKSSHWS